MQAFVKYGLTFIGLFVLQVLVVNNITLFHLLHPYVYFMFLLVLPLGIPQWGVLLLSFFSGMVMDLFTFTPGMHASACVFIGFVRPFALRIFRPRMGTTEDLAPHLYSLGFGNYLLYALTLTFLHQFVLHFMEVFELAEFELTLLRIVINTGSSLLLVVVIELLIFFRNPSGQ